MFLLLINNLINYNKIIQVLLDKADPVTARSLTTSYEWLTNPDKMGERFKFMAVTNSSQHIPTPF